MRFTLLRVFVAAMLVANLAYALWHASPSRGAAAEREPARLEQQVRPDALRVLTPAATAAAVGAAASAAAVGPLLPTAPMAESPVMPALPASASTTAAPAGSTAPAQAAASAGPLACLEIGPLDSSAALDAAERALAAVLPTRPWVREQRAAPVQYAVFVGPVLSRDAARLRRDELVKLKLSFDAIEVPDGSSAEGKQGGYSLGRHASESEALAALEGFRERGLRNGSVVLSRPAGAARPWLRLERLSPAQVDAVQALPVAPFDGAKPAECVVGSVMSTTPPR